MADIAFPGRRTVSPPAGRLITAEGMVGLLMLLFHILTSINWSSVQLGSRRCEIHRGAFSNAFSKEFDVSREDCRLPNY
jgi:hypothetical protein